MTIRSKVSQKNIFLEFVLKTPQPSLRYGGACCSAQMARKPVQQQELRAYCPNLYTVIKRHASWGLLRNRIINAKISDALSNIKFTINGKNFRALRCIGEGGYSRY